MSDQEDKVPALGKQIEREITDYLTKEVNLGDGVSFSQSKLVRRIALFESHTYPTGKTDSQGNYKFWFDIITPRIDSEVKNIDFDTKNVEAFSPRKIDEVPNIIVNLSLSDWMRENGQAEEFNSAIEEGAGWGNIVWKRVRGGYERVDLRNFYVINQTAQSLKQSPVIEHHELQQSDLRANATKWKHVDDVISKCSHNTYKSKPEATENETTTPFYSIYERNGEVSLKALKEYRGEDAAAGDENTYVYAKVIAAGVEATGGASVKIKYVLFADQLSKVPYKEYHRGRYKGRWFREGLYELLFDCQVRANEIGNQISRGLEWAAKVLFNSADKLIIQNLMTDLKNGDVLRSQGVSQIETRMQGFDQLVADYNRIINLANDIANSREVVQGITPASGTPLGTTELLNANAGKLFDFIREKLSIPLRELFEEWIVPALVSDLKAEDVLRLTGDSDMLARLHTLIVEDWYVTNLLEIGPHGPEEAVAIKAEKLEELKSRPLFLSAFQKMLTNYKPRVAVVITGENVDLPEKLAALGTFIALEADPVRRSYLIERAMRLKGIDAGSLPRSTPDQLMGVKPPMPSAERQPAKAA